MIPDYEECTSIRDEQEKDVDTVNDFNRIDHTYERTSSRDKTERKTTASYHPIKISLEDECVPGFEEYRKNIITDKQRDERKLALEKVQAIHDRINRIRRRQGEFA